MVVLAACYHPSPAVGLPCSASGECPQGQLCDLAASPPTCVAISGDAGADSDAPADVALGCADSSDCTQDTASICDLSTRVCRGCVADAECSGACTEYDGRCVVSGQVIFLSATGVDGGNCTANMPCRSLAFGLTQITANRRVIRVGDGNYAAAAGSVTLSISNTGGRIVVSGTDRAAAGAELTALTNGVTNPVVVDTGDRTDVVLEGLTIKGGPNDGVRSDAALLLSRVEITDNNGRGVSSNAQDGETVRVWDSRIAGNDNEGINAQNGPFELLRTVVVRNVRGGVVLERTAATIVGSMIVANGGTGSGVGGLSLKNLGVNVQTLAFITLANNLASGSNVAGVDSEGPVAISSSIMADNTNGTPGAPQVSAGVTATYSLFSGAPLVGTGNLVAAPGFVDPVLDDYHLRATSAARDAADPAATVRLDLDGDPRPLGNGFDIGADEAP